MRFRTGLRAGFRAERGEPRLRPSIKANVFAVLVAVAALGLSAAAPAGEGATVRIGHDRVEPAEVTVEAGETVTFLNEEKMPGGHTIAATDGSFSSPPLDVDERWTKTFEEPGSYEFRIEEHPEATGTVVVE